MDAEGDELLTAAEDLDAGKGHLRERRVRAVEQQALRPLADAHQRRAQPVTHELGNAVRKVGVSEIDVDADQRPGAQADAGRRHTGAPIARPTRRRW